MRPEVLLQTLVRDGIRDQRVLAAVASVPRDRFVPERLRSEAWRNHPLPIGHEQTISQPWIVARMTELLRPEPHHRALEVGTGSGYQAAVLARLVQHVTSLEIVPELAASAAARLEELGVDNVEVHRADGHAGWPAGAPYDLVIVTAAPEEVPEALVEQLAPGGRMVVPVGPQGRGQTLTFIEKEADGQLRLTRGVPVIFVPMTGGQ